MITRRSLPTPLARPLLLALLLLVGCAGTDEKEEPIVPPAGETDWVVEEVELEIEPGRSEEIEIDIDRDEILEGLANRDVASWRTAIPWMPLLGAEPVYFNELEWERDKERVENYFKALGYFNVSVDQAKSEPQGGAVRLKLTVKLNEPVRVTELIVFGLEGLEGLSEERPEACEGEGFDVIDGTEWTAELPIEEGAIFTEEDYLTAKTELRRRVQAAAYAYAQVYGRVLVDAPSRAARVSLFVDPGPRTSFGEVAVENNEEIPRATIMESVDIQQGCPYSAERLLEVQDRIYELGVFSLVSVQPAHELAEAREGPGAEAEEGLGDASIQDRTTAAEKITIAEESDEAEDLEPAQETAAEEGQPGPLGISALIADAATSARVRATMATEVNVIITVNEARMWNLRLGVGAGFDVNLLEGHVQANYTNRNLFGGLRKLEWFNTLGYGWSPAVPIASGASFGENDGVILDSIVQFEQPQFLERHTVGLARVEVRRDVNFGFELWNPSGRVGLRRRFLGDLTVDIGYNLSYFLFTDVINDATITNTNIREGNLQEEDLQFLLTYLDQVVRWDKRDNPINPLRGYQLSLSLAEAADFLGGEFDYIRVHFDAEGYLPYKVFVPQVLALHLGVGSIYDLDDDQGLPIMSRFFGGGRGSVRSFAGRFLSPFSDYDNPPVPIGGLSLLEATIEPRFRMVRSMLDVGDLWGALFLDVGTVFARPLFLTPAGAGPGAEGRQSERGPADAALRRRRGRLVEPAVRASAGRLRRDPLRLERRPPLPSLPAEPIQRPQHRPRDLPAHPHRAGPHSATRLRHRLQLPA